MAATRRSVATNNGGAIKLVAGNSNPALATAIGAYLETPLTKAVVRRFADMEIFVEIQENVRGADVFVIQSTSFPANDHLMELLIIIDALRRSSAKRITAVLPYFGYARQDRKPGARTPISAKLVANLVTTAGADRQRWLNPLDSSLVIGTLTGCLSKWATASRKSSSSREAISWLTPRRTRMRCTAISETAPVRV